MAAESPSSRETCGGQDRNPTIKLAGHSLTIIIFIIHLACECHGLGQRDGEHVDHNYPLALRGTITVEIATQGRFRVCLVTTPMVPACNQIMR